MANDTNIVVLVGRLTRDAELRYTNSGTAVGRFSLAVNRRKRSGDVWEDEVSYFDVVLWGKQAESISKYLEKGKQISVQGELHQNRWEQDGQARSRIEIIASNVQLLGNSGSSSGGSQQNTGGYPAASEQRTARPQPVRYDGPEQFDDDIPF